jgi:hypothetical protein
MRKSNLFAFLALILSWIPLQNAAADTGPKPGMEFEFVYETASGPLLIEDGVQYECGQPDCSDAIILEDAGPQGFRCDETTCSSVAYGYRDYHYLELTFSDGKTRQSNVFQTAGFNSAYKVTVREDDLLVEPRLLNPNTIQPYLLLFFLCLCSLGILGIIALGVFLLVRFTRKK